MYRALRFFATKVKPQPEKSSPEYVERMNRIRNIEENRTMDLLWEGLAKIGMPKIVIGLLPFYVLPQLGAAGYMIYADFNSPTFTFAICLGSTVLASSAGSLGAILLGLEALRYHPLNTEKIPVFSGMPRVGVGLMQLALAMVIIDSALREDWKGSVSALVVQCLSFAFILTSARYRVVPYWVVTWTACHLVSSGVLSLFMAHTIRNANHRKEQPSK